MAIGKRIRLIRNLRGMTQKHLGTAIGFIKSTVEVQTIQYESGARAPKEKMVADFANALGISPRTLILPDIDNHVGLTHTLFALEDIYGLHIDVIDDQLCLRLDRGKGNTYLSMFDIFNAWQQEAEKLKKGEITKEEYDQWHYHYPNLDTAQRRVKVPSQQLIDFLIQEK